jgi:hypothetical protein
LPPAPAPAPPSPAAAPSPAASRRGGGGGGDGGGGGALSPSRDIVFSSPLAGGGGGKSSSPPLPSAPSSPAPSSARSRSPASFHGSPPQDHHVTAFHAALQKGDAAGAAAQLKKQPALANAAHPRTGETPLHAAVRAMSLPLVQLLVLGGADVAAVDKAGRTAEAAAAADGKAGMAAWLRGAAQAASTTAV